VLRASHRVLKTGGTIAFTVIGTVDGITSTPTNFDGYITAASEYLTMLHKAGFSDLAETDVTKAFHVTARTWLEAASDLEADLRAVLGDEGYRDKVANRTETFDAIESGDICRRLITAIA
jgi:hypothetical protein